MGVVSEVDVMVMNLLSLKYYGVIFLSIKINVIQLYSVDNSNCNVFILYVLLFIEYLFATNE